MKLDYNIKVKGIESKDRGLRARKGYILWGRRKEAEHSMLRDQRERTRGGHFEKQGREIFKENK